MNGFVQDIEGIAVKNGEFRRVVYTAKHFDRTLARRRHQVRRPARRTAHRAVTAGAEKRVTDTYARLQAKLNEAQGAAKDTADKARKQ